MKKFMFLAASNSAWKVLWCQFASLCESRTSLSQVRQLAAAGSDALRDELRELCRRAGVRPAEPVALLVTEANCGDELLAHVSSPPVTSPYTHLLN